MSIESDEDFVSDGALPDVRPQKERDKDYNAKELASAHHVVSFRHSKPTKLGATLYSQEYTSSCVAHAILTQLEYEGLIKPSPKGYSQLLNYRKRQYYPNPGAWAVDLYERLREGQHKHSVAPVKPKHREAEANQLPYLVGEKMMPEFNYFSITDYKSVPGEVSSGKAVVVFIWATNAEWSKEYVTVIEPDLKLEGAYVRHAVCLMPNGDFKEKEGEWLTVHDSAGFGGRHLRYISKDFLLNRCYYASKVYPKNNIPNPEPPVTTLPTVPCEFKQESKDVRNLQGYLIREGYLDSQYQTGYYGVLTAKALLEWQLVHYKEFNYVRPVRELLSLEGKWFGQQSIDIITKS